MKCSFINIKLNDKKSLINNTISELLNLSIGNKKFVLSYNKNKKESLNKNKEISFYKKFSKKNIVKMIYKTIKNKEIKIVNKLFISENIKRAKLIINNKQYELKENIQSKKAISKIKIKFLDNIININSMFKNCESLSSVHNLKNLNTKYLKEICKLFVEC